jgi:mRNA interferase RelE/StbE
MSSDASDQTYRVQIEPSALDALKALPEKERRRVGKKINTLAFEPRSRKAEKLEGEENLYRIRSGDYRILYQIHDDVFIVVVVRVANRRDAYRHL